MKKIKAKIINEYNRYLISFRNSIIKELRSLRSSLLKEFSRFSLLTSREFSRLSSLTRKTFLYFVRLKFMKSKKIRISLLSRYLILFIILLFSSLFYLSIPTLYDHGQLQKDLTKKLSQEFNLNTALSANIHYKILPSPNFEISNVLLNTDDNNKFNDYAEIKTMKIYVSLKNLHNQNRLEIKNIVISKANFNINKNSYDYVNNYLKNKLSNKKIQIKKSKIFFKESNLTKDVVALSTISKFSLFYDKKDNVNKINIEGSIYNTKYNFSLLRNAYKKNTTDFLIKLKKLNAIIKNEFVSDENKKNSYSGKASISFSGSEINTIYKKVDKLITFNSEKSQLNNHTFNFKGEIITSPFYYSLDVNLETINVIKLIESLSKLKNLLDEKILLNDNLNGKITFNINSLKGIKFFDEAKVDLKIIDGKLMLSNSTLTSNKIGKMLFIDSVLETVDNKTIFKSKILFKISDQKKFYQKLLISKNYRIKLNNIYFEVEKDLNIDDVKIKKIILNKKIADNSSNKTTDLTNLIDISEIKRLKNWIELKKFSSQVFSEISKLN